MVMVDLVLLVVVVSREVIFEYIYIHVTCIYMCIIMYILFLYIERYELRIDEANNTNNTWGGIIYLQYKKSKNRREH